MAFNPNNSRHIQSFLRQWQESRRKLRPFRDRTRRAVSRYTGGMIYSDDTEEVQPVPINLMELAATIISHHLLPSRPQALVRTYDRQYRPYGIKLESFLNTRLRVDDSVHRELQRVVKASLFGMGVTKVGLRGTGNIEVDGERFDFSEPFLSSILLDDWVHDMAAMKEEAVRYMGHRFQEDIESVRENKDYDRVMRQKVKIPDRRMYNEEGDQRIGTLSRGFSDVEETDFGLIDLWEIYFRRERLVCTFASTNSEKPLLVREMEDDPEPYEWLWYQEVPGQTVPLAPAMLWTGLHTLANSLYQKLANQAVSAKRIGLTRGEDTGDALKINSAREGEVVPVNNLDGLTQADIGGIDQRGFLFFVDARQLFKEINGNLDLLGGLSSSSETLGQDQILSANANNRIRSMQENVRDHIGKVISRYAYYVWSDPVSSFPVELALPQLSSPLSVEFAPDDRAHDFFKHAISIETYAQQTQTPTQRLQTILQIFSGVITPAMPLMQAQGVNVDMVEFMQLIAKYADLPELSRMLRLGEYSLENVPSSTTPNAGPVSQRQAPQARPQRSREGEMTQALLSGSDARQTTGTSF